MQQGDKRMTVDNDKKASKESETILMALDQISQTIDVMTSVVGRLRTYLQEQQSAQEQESATQTDSGNKNPVPHIQGSRTVH